MNHHPPIEQNWDKLHIAWFWGTPVQFLRHKRSPALFVAVSEADPDLFVQAHSVFGLDRKTQAIFERRAKQNRLAGGLASRHEREGISGEEQQGQSTHRGQGAENA